MIKLSLKGFADFMSAVPPSKEPSCGSTNILTKMRPARRSSTTEKHATELRPITSMERSPSGWMRRPMALQPSRQEIRDRRGFVWATTPEPSRNIDSTLHTASTRFWVTLHCTIPLMT